MHETARGKNNFDVTNAEVGLPGSAKTNEFLNFAKVVGLPGFILSLPKWMTPYLYKNGFIKSRSPIDTPPVVIIISQKTADSSNLAWS